METIIALHRAALAHDRMTSALVACTNALRAAVQAQEAAIREAHDIERLSFREIARICGVSHETVRRIVRSEPENGGQE